MRRIVLVAMTGVACIVNLIITGFAQDAAYRTYEYLGSSSSRYSTVGALIVPLAAESTFIQFLAAAMPLIVVALNWWRRWPLSIAVSLVVTIEMIVAAWCWLVHILAELPFTQG